MMDHGSTYSDLPSLSASLEDFDPERSMHSAYSARSNMHSSRWSVPPPEHEESEAESEGPWAPPAWQKNNSQWFRKSIGDSGLRSSPSKSPAASRYQYRADREITPSRIPLPDSPMKGSPRTSPEPIPEHEQWLCTPDTIASRMQSPSVEPQTNAGAQQHAAEEMDSPQPEEPGKLDGFVKFVFKGETLFHTAPLEEGISSVLHGISTTKVISSLLVLLLSCLLIHPWNTNELRGPDVANLANMAKQFEPLMYASENVIPRSRELAEASIAVQDLGESVRASNMSGSRVIIDQLDDLGDSLKVLSEQITSFFTNVDGDMDSIIHAMEWAKRQLQSIQGPKAGVIDTIIGNVHGGLGRIGALERNGQITVVGKMVTEVMGHTAQQRAKETLQLTFDYLLSTLEENLANELARADILFQLFDSVDRQFHNLHRSVAKEEDSLAAKKDEFLASLWRTTITNKLKLKKYDRNLRLLKDVRASTLANKSELKSNIQIIHTVRDQLDKARKNLVSPLIRGAQSNSFGIEQQLEDLSGTHGFLKGVRDSQKPKFIKQLFAESNKPIRITSGRDDDDEEAEY